MKTAVAVGAIETVRDKDGKVIKLSVTFLNNANTWKKDHGGYSVKVLDCREYKDAPSPMKALWDAIAAAHGDRGIDCLMISSHSDWEGLYLFSKIRKELAELDRYVTLETEWPFKFNPGAKIELHGCQAGGRFGEKWPTSIAQKIADSTGVSVWAFLSRTAQKRRADGGFYQRPDRGKLTEFTPAPGKNSIKETEEKQTAAPT